MTKDQKLRAALTLLAEFRAAHEEAKSREDAWGREAAYFSRMAELHKAHAERAGESVAWLEQIIQEIEVGKL